MLAFDLDTLVTIVALVAILLLLLCTLGVDQDAMSPSVRWWATSLAMGCVTAALIAARNFLPATPAYVLSNLLLMTAPLMQLRALQLSVGQRPPWLALLAVAGFGVVSLVWLAVIGAAREPRVVAAGLYFCLAQGTVMWLCITAWRQQPARPLLWMAATNGVFLLVFMYRVVRAATVGLGGADAYASDSFNGLVYIVTLMHMIIGTIAFLLLQMLQLQRRLHETAVRDVLTGLLNRRGLQPHVDAALSLARRAGTPLALAVIDIDHFKRINDRHGHTAGDAALRRVAEILKRTTRPSDSVARLGGEEFVVLMPGVDASHSEPAAHRLRAALSGEPMSVGPLTVKITVSIGVAQWSPGMDSWDALFAQADDAVYRAKRSGRNRVVLAGSDRPGPASGGADFDD